jgi:putative phosphoesterase
MKIGIIADTHDRLPLIDEAIQELNRERVELVLHAGDYIAPFVVSKFKPLKARLVGVFGNNDAERDLLNRKFSEIGAQIRGRFAELKIEGLKIALMHGDEAELLDSIIKTDSYDIVVHGHTHQAVTRKEGDTLIVNPGEVCGYLSEQATFALVETETLDVKIQRLKM